MASGFDAIYIERYDHCQDVVSFWFEKPVGHAFKPGQWFRLTLDVPGGTQLTETFSYSSAPGDVAIEFTTRISGSAFKTALDALVPGQTAHIVGPGGRLTIPDDLQRVVFLTGGTGITPVRSILRDAEARGRRFDDALVLYGNRDETCVPFGAEFAEMADIGVRLVLCFERASDSWQGERGFITADTVKRHVAVDSRPFVVTGPPVMVGAMERVLDELSVPAERRLVERYGPA